MSCVCVLTPVVIAAWPSFSAAVLSAASALGYTVATTEPSETVTRRVSLEVDRSEIVTDPLGRDQRLAITRDGVTITFSRDARGRAAICVSGPGRTDEALRALGEQLAQRVVQQYVYQRLKSEFAARQMMIVEESIEGGQAIRLRVRQWQN
jgi:hypothetical protein